MTIFIPKKPILFNQYEDDQLLKEYVNKIIPLELKDEIEGDLKRFGSRVVSDILTLGEEAEQNEPQLIESEGKKSIQIHQSWNLLKNVAAEEGLIALGQDAKFGKYARVYQFLKKYLFNSSSAYFSCPLAMTDGALKLLKDLNTRNNPELSHAISCLSSCDPEKFWTSGQWMTEQKGGSDVSNTETIAKPTAEYDGETHRLYGLKWFTSAVDSEMALTLAKPENSDKLQLFYVKTKDLNGELNNIKIHGLKNKLGTKALPTAELELCGVPAIAIGKAGDGVKLISTQFNVTRIHNALECVSSMRRQLALLKDYAENRCAFGKKLISQPLFEEVYLELIEIHRRCFLFTMKVVELLGASENGDQVATNQLRLLTPLLKLYTAKENIKLSSEVLECFGGVGYIEDSGIPKFYRDAQVLSIWEGTTNILSLDFLRAIKKYDVDLLKDLVDQNTLSNLKNNISQYESSRSLERNARNISLDISHKIACKISQLF